MSTVVPFNRTHEQSPPRTQKTHKKCIKCRQWKPRVAILNDDGTIKQHKGFGTHPDSPDGLQVICQPCKSKMNIKTRNRNPTARIRHHTATRCLTQLDEHVPSNFVANIENYLGYKVRTLVKHLSSDLKEREGRRRKLVEALDEGYHIDHIHPLSKFSVIGDDGVDWEEFKRCWAITNLRAIPAKENLAKGAKVE